MMTSAQVVETSVTTTDNSSSQDYTHPDDQTTLLHLLIFFVAYRPPPALHKKRGKKADQLVINNVKDISNRPFSFLLSLVFQHNFQPHQTVHTSTK